MKEHCTAVVLAAGRGTRMGTQTAKQYLELQGKPILVYALEVFEQSAVVDDILLMTDKDHVEYCKKEICEKYGIKKVSAVAPGGKERYESVWKALCILKERGQSGFVMIHDGARPFVKKDLLDRLVVGMEEHKAVLAMVPCKDTIKRVKDGKVVETLIRSELMQAQTPQAFDTVLIRNAYKEAIENNIQATDDASMLELQGKDVYVVEGDYDNIKITTKEDLKQLKNFD